MNCLKCGNEVRESAVFCTYCGTNVKEQPMQTAGNHSNTIESPQEVVTDDVGALLDNILVFFRNQEQKQAETLQQKDELIVRQKEDIRRLEAELLTLQSKMKELERSKQQLEEVCPNCGKEVTENVSFCNQCGTKVR